MSTFRFRRFSVANSESAMKVNTDGVLLGALMTLRAADRNCLDVGTGTGTVALMAAQRLYDAGVSDARITAIDIDGPSAREAAVNFAGSPWPDMLEAKHLPLSGLSVSKLTIFARGFGDSNGLRSSSADSSSLLTRADTALNGDASKYFIITLFTP